MGRLGSLQSFGLSTGASSSRIEKIVKVDTAESRHVYLLSPSGSEHWIKHGHGGEPWYSEPR